MESARCAGEWKSRNTSKFGLDNFDSLDSFDNFDSLDNFDSFDSFDSLDNLDSLDSLDLKKILFFEVFWCGSLSLDSMLLVGLEYEYINPLKEQLET